MNHNMSIDRPMKKPSLFAIAAAVILISTPAHAEGWLCIADSIAGFQYHENSKKWEPATSKAQDKYIIRRPKEGDIYPIEAWIVDYKSAKWGVYKFGESIMQHPCPNEIEKLDRLNCGFRFQGFSMAGKTLRYMQHNLAGYTNHGPKGMWSDSKENTPYIEIGKCSPL